MFITDVGRDKKQLMVRYPNIIDIIEGVNTITSLLALKLSRNMRMLSETHGKDRCYLCKEASLPILTPETILEIEHFSWCTRSLDEDPASLKSILIAWNFCGPPTNQADYKQYVNMETRLANSHREEQLGQHVE